MKRAASIIAVVLSVGMSLAGWRGRFDEQFAAATASWSPASIPGLVWWVDAASISDIVSGERLSTWPDLSTSQKHATATGDTRPTYLTDKLNGLPVVNTTNNPGAVFMTFDEVSNIRTVYIVCNYTGTPSYFEPILGHTSLAPWHGNNDIKLFRPLSASSPGIRTATVFENGTQVAVADVNKPLENYSILTFITTENAPANQLSRDRWHADRTWKGNYAEVLFYSEPHDANTRKKIEAYLSKKWGLAITH